MHAFLHRVAKFALLGQDMNSFHALRSFLFSLTIAASVVIAIQSPSRSATCLPDQRDALSRFNRSFSIISELDPKHQTVCYPVHNCIGTSYPKTASWREDQDCCSWEGVRCDPLTGNVVKLDLSCARLRGAIDSRSSLFSLRHLRSLDLYGNDLLSSTIPPEISVFSRMMRLNLSVSGVAGNVPTEISRLSKLVSLDLSGNFELAMQTPTMRMLVRNLTQLEELHLREVNMSSVTLTSMMNFTSSLTSLVISECSLRGEFPGYIFQLPNLQNLDLSRNFGLQGTLPESNWSRSLSFLSLQDCQFTGEVPRSIGRLPRLTSLGLSWNNFTGHVDFQTFSTLENLRLLWLSGLSLSGKDDTDEKHKFPKLEELDISEGSLNNFPCLLSGMPELRELTLMYTDISKFPGQCVTNGPAFRQLRKFDMRNSTLTKFPSFLSHSNKLRFLDLSGNLIEEIPSWFMGIGTDTLEELDLSSNRLKGVLRVPWKRLTDLHLENNFLEGPLPTLPPSIQEFDASWNRFSGSISPSLCRRTSLAFLALSQNKLNGLIPPCLGNLTVLRNLDLSRNSLIGPLPLSLANGTGILYLDVSYNLLDRCPGDFPTMSLYIYLSNNNFEGPLPIPSDANSYSVSNNHFSGEISSLLCNNTNLNLLDLSNNSLTGTLPHCMKNITTNLMYLNIRVNKFHGPIPEIFPNGSRLASLDFSRNQFEGSLPRSLSNCQSLEVLDVGGNKIVDSFPDWLGDLPLKVLSLRSDKFHGRISVSPGTRLFSKLRILDLSNNGFEGNLSENLISEMFDMAQRGDDTGYMSVYLNSLYYSVMIDLKGVETEIVKIYVDFSTLDMSSNHFWGEIPRNIGWLKSLKGLNFSHNGFSGSIPSSLGNLTNLESLDLSSNHLMGEIPKELVKLTSLGALDLSQNNLTGPIPAGGHFNTFSNNSFKGNPGLCGIPLTRECDQGHAQVQLWTDRGHHGEDWAGGWIDWKFVVMGFGSGVGIGISLGYMVLETARPLWLARMIIRLQTNCKKRSKRKAPRRNARR